MKTFTFSPLSSPSAATLSPTPSTSQSLPPSTDIQPSPLIASKYSAFTKIQPRQSSLALDITNYEYDTHIPSPQYSTPEIKGVTHHRHGRTHSHGSIGNITLGIPSPSQVPTLNFQTTDLSPLSPANLAYLMSSPSVALGRLSIVSPRSPTTLSPGRVDNAPISPTKNQGSPSSYGAAPKRIRSKHTSDSLLGKDLSPTRHRRSRSTTDDVKLVAARQFIQASIACSGAHTDIIPTQKQIQKAGMDTRWQQVGRNYLRDLHIVSVDTKTRLTPEYTTLAQVDVYLAELQRQHEEDGVPVPPSSQTLAAIAAGIPIKQPSKKSGKTQSEMMAHRPVDMTSTPQIRAETMDTAATLLAAAASVTNPFTTPLSSETTSFPYHRSSVPTQPTTTHPSPFIRHQRSATYDASIPLPMPIPITSPFITHSMAFPLPLALPVEVPLQQPQEQSSQSSQSQISRDDGMCDQS